VSLIIKFIYTNLLSYIYIYIYINMLQDCVIRSYEGALKERTKTVVGEINYKI